MSKLKKLSFVLIFGLTLLASLFGFGLSTINIGSVNAENDYIELVVKKVKYSNDEIYHKNDDGTPTTTPTTTKKLGEYSQEELVKNYENITKSSSNFANNGDVLNGEVVSINKKSNEAVLVYLHSADGTAFIRTLNANVVLKTEGKNLTYTLDTQSILPSSENRIAIAAFDFSDIINSYSNKFEYNSNAHFSFTFTYQYSTGTNTLSDSKTFDFYLIDENAYFSDDNIFTANNVTTQTKDNITTLFHNKQMLTNNNFNNLINPVLSYNPFKFSPTIVYSYNETSAILSTQTEYNSLLNTYKFNLISSNQNIFANKVLELDNNKINLELDRVGKYTISYNLVVNEDENLTIIDSEKTQNIEKLNAQTLHIFGYEALYKNYEETNQEIIKLNQNYKPLFNENYQSDFSYEFKVESKDITVENIAENVKDSFNDTNSSDLIKKIATTNQAPVKLNGYVTENLSGAKYYVLTKSTDVYSFDDENGYNFTSSKRFESEGLYCVIIPYKFSNLSDETYFSVMIFKIEKSTPQISFYNDTNDDEKFDENDKLLNANGFTNQRVFVVWNNEEDLSPFSYPNKIQFVKNNQILTINDVKTTNDGKQKYVVFEENGEYLVQLTFGTQQTTIEKKFIIDNSTIEFKIVETTKDNAKKEYQIGKNIELTDDKTTTTSDFAIFVKNKDIKSNSLTVKYDYISLDNVTAQKQFEIINVGTDEKPEYKLLIYNNYKLSNLVSNSTYSNSTLNNLDELENLSIDKNNSIAVISINALYKFTISDLAGNTKTFFILRDNTENVVLESNSLVKIGTVTKLNNDTDLEETNQYLSLIDETNKEAVLNVKDKQVNLVSNNYSVIFGDYKALEFEITDDNLNFAKEYFKNENLPNNLTGGQKIFKHIEIENRIDEIKYENLISSDAEIENSIITQDKTTTQQNNNIFTVEIKNNPDEVDVIFILSLTNGTKREFELNTDRNQILIFGKDETGAYTRVYQSSPTKLDGVYITFKNDVNGDDYDLESLNLKFYPITTTTDAKIQYSSDAQDFDILSSSTSGQIVIGENSYGSFVSPSLFLTFDNGKYVSREGKYVITKQYKNGENYSQTFYVDRKNPLSYFDDILIGNNINISLDGKNLSAEKIYKLILNNTSLKTNMLNFAWKNSTENGKDLGFVYKYPDIEDDKSNLKLNFALFNTSSAFISSNITLQSGDYTLFIYDNTYRFTDVPTQTEIRNNTNYAEIQISVNTDRPSGYFIKESGETVTGSTNTNKLSFVFEDNESEFMYKIDLNNIVLKRNDLVIFKTTTDASARTGTFTLSDSKNTTQVHYISTIGNVFSLKREEINSVYRYTLSILDPSKNSVMFENGKSLEAVYNLEISYANNNSFELKNEKGENFGKNNFEIIIDHTAPNSNFLTYLENDKLLSSEQKEDLKQSFINKDVSGEINFDNYVFITSVVPEFSDKTDTDMIYVRYYNKYSNENIENQQSLVSGDPRYDDKSITSKYRFDINTYVEGNKLYTSKEYNLDSRKNDNLISTSNFFFKGEGFYEIIEVDEAGNYSVYTVYFVENPALSALYTLSTTSEGEYEQTQEELTQATDPNFKLCSINSKYGSSTEGETKNIEFDYLKVDVLINENAENGETHTLIYLPFSVSNTIYATYFTSQESLINAINEIIKNYNSLNEYGNICKISISNRLGTTIIIENSTPNKEFEIKDYIKNYDNNKIVITIPNSINNATFIKTLKVHPVINGKKGSALKKDSNKAGIPEQFEQNQSYVFTFTDTAYTSSTSNETVDVNIYYFEWTDNFGRTQTTVRHLGEKSESKFILEDNAQFVVKNQTNYTQNDSNIFFSYSPTLYNICIEYQLLPSNQKLQLYPYNSSVENDEIATKINNTIATSNGKLDLFDLYKKLLTEKDNKDNIDYQIKFIITLTDLTKIGEEQNTETYSYIYYPLMPTFEFSDSSSNILGIKANDNNTISTSKNVHLSYVNNTLFNISSIVVTRTYVDSKNQEVSEQFNITKNEYTFSEIGNYEIEVTNELGRTETYKFNITTKTNKTYSVETNEQNMTNFELSSCGTINVNSVSYELYMSIFKAKVVVNSDFNLSSQIIEIKGYENYTFYQILKNNKDVYKYIAIKKVDYNSNFLNLGTNECSLNIEDIYGNKLISNIKNFTLTSTNGLKISLPMYNEDEKNEDAKNEDAKNEILIKLYYNNTLINLNANIYSIDTENAIQTLTLNNVPSGVYSIYFEDIAGNTQLFNGNSFLNLAINKEIAVKINDEIPVDYQVYNSTVKLSIINEKQYIQSSGNKLTLEATRNNKKIEKLVKDENKNYIFSDYGFYKITIKGYIDSSTEISRTLYFTILNPNEALKEYSFMSLNGQNITKILRDGRDVTTEIKRILALSPVYSSKDANENEIYDQAELKNLLTLLQTDFEKSYLYNLMLKSQIEYVSSFLDENDNTITNLKELNLTQTQVKPNIEKYDASGNYEIFVTTQNLILGSTEYSFKLWIRDADAKININSTLQNGGTTSKAITLSFNPYLIYTQIGECNILVGNNIIAQINAESLNEVNSYVIPKDAKGTFIVQVKSANGNTELSMVLNKTEPFSTVSIILIVLASLVVAGGIFLFIKLRTRMKVK